MTKLKLQSIIVIFIVVDHYVYGQEPLRIYRGNYDTVDNPTYNCTAMNAYCTGSDTPSRCLRCTCFGQYKTYLPSFDRCVRDNRLLFFPVGNSSFLIQAAKSNICITYDRLHHNITSAICKSSDSSQHWIWTQHGQLLNVETLKCIQRGQAYPGSSYTSYLSLEECNITKQEWRCEPSYIRQLFYRDNGQEEFMYITFENDLILGKVNAPTVWKRRNWPVLRNEICYLRSGCNEFTNPTSSMLVLDANYQRQGEQQIADLPGTRKCSVSPNQLQFLDYKYWRQVEYNETAIFVISSRKSGAFLKWDLTRAPSNWTNLIIRLNFNCTVNSDIISKCVLIKLKGSSDSVQTTKSAPGTPTVPTYYNATNAGTKSECIDCTTPKSAIEGTPESGLEQKSTNSIALFFVGGAVTLAIVLVVIFIIYKRRRQAPKLSTGVLAVDAVEMQNQSPAEPSQNNQGQGYVIPVGETTPVELGYDNPIDDETAPYEEVQISPPPPDGLFQKLLKHDSDYVIPAQTKAESSYEEVQISPPSVYAQLDMNQRARNYVLYQKLLKRDSDYVIPAQTEAEPSYEEVGKIKTHPGYMELDITKRVQDDSAYYQKLIKK